MIVEIVQNFQSNFPPKKRDQAPSKTPEKQRRGGEGNEGKFSSNKRRGCKLCELEGCASLAGGQGSLPKKKKNRKKIANERRRSKFLACFVLNTTIRVALSKGPVTERGSSVECPIDGMEEKKKKAARVSNRPAWLSADFRNYRVESRGLSGSTRGRVSYRAPEASKHTMESRVYRVTTMIRVPLRFK